MPREALQRGYFRLTRSITLHRKFSSKMIRLGLGTEREREKEKDHFAILRLRISDGQGLSFPLSPPLLRFMQICAALTVILFLAHKSNTGHAAGVLARHILERRFEARCTYRGG